MSIPVVVGNCVTYSVALELMEAGISGLLVGVGPGRPAPPAASWAWAFPGHGHRRLRGGEDFFFKKAGRYVPIITDGGMSTGGDICKAIACGSDGVMVGSAFARTRKPGPGLSLGMATPHHNLPRGTRIHVGVTGTLEEILFALPHR